MPTVKYSKMGDSGTFDLDKLVRYVPVMRGWGFSLYATLQESIFGYPLRVYLSKTNLEPIEREEIREEPTYYPYQPLDISQTNPKSPDNIEDLAWQYNFLEQNTLGSSYFKSILDYHKMYLTREQSPEEVVEKIKNKIEESNSQEPPLKCFTQLDWDLARKAASESSLRYENNRPLSVLDGIPIGVKDEYNVAGFRANSGRKVEEEINEEDCDIVAALRKLGVVVIGITNMHEMGMGVTGINPTYGTPRNPYNDGHMTGGSSSGSATAVAAGIVPFALGSDGGGSVRIPSAFCGMQGIKPTYSRLSSRGTAFVNSSVTSAGVIANNVADVALVTSILSRAAPEPKFFSPRCEIPIRCLSDKDLSDITFGTYSEYVNYRTDKEILEVFEKEVKPKLSNLKEIELEELYLNKISHMNTILAETAHARRIWDEHSSTLNPQTRMVYSICSRSTLRQYMMSAAQKTRAINMFKALFEDEIDLLITPTTACLPKALDPRSLAYGEYDESNMLSSMWFVYLANLCGLPSVTINAGYSSSGLPVGVMITGPWWSEGLVLRAATQLETDLRKPSRFYCPI